MIRVQRREFMTLPYDAGKREKIPSEVIDEQPVSLPVNNEPWLEFMCTPYDLESTAGGFLPCILVRI